MLSFLPKQYMQSIVSYRTGGSSVENSLRMQVVFSQGRKPGKMGRLWSKIFLVEQEDIQQA